MTWIAKGLCVSLKSISCLPVTTRLWETFCFSYFFFPGQFRLALELWTWSDTRLQIWIYVLQCVELFSFNFDPQFVAFILPTSNPWILSYSQYELYIKLKLQLADWKICVHATAFRQKPLRNQVIFFHNVTLRSKDDRRGQNHPGSYWIYILFVLLTTN